VLTVITHYLRMIKFSHTLFAMPFALAALVVVAARYRHAIVITWQSVLLIAVAFSAMRSLAMAANRIFDRAIDARNPRTKGREIPAGILSTQAVAVFAVLSAVVLCASAYLLAPLAGVLALPAAAIVIGYSFAKRFTWLCHFWLGAAIGLAPMAVYIALLQRIQFEAVLMSVALMFYIAGFDILYALQDREFDRAEKLQSIPARFGIGAAMWVSRLSHILTLAAVAALIVALPLSPWSWFAFGLLAVLLFSEHYLVGSTKNPRYEKIPIAFFHVNSAFSLVFLATVAIGVFLP